MSELVQNVIEKSQSLNKNFPKKNIETNLNSKENSKILLNSKKRNKEKYEKKFNDKMIEYLLNKKENSFEDRNKRKKSSNNDRKKTLANKIENNYSYEIILTEPDKKLKRIEKKKIEEKYEKKIEENDEKIISFYHIKNFNSHFGIHNKKNNSKKSVYLDILSKRNTKKLLLYCLLY